MLETIREYALEQLNLSGDSDAVHRRQAAYFQVLAEAGAPVQLYDAPELTWVQLMGTELDNVRAALHWSHSASGAARPGLRLAAALSVFSFGHGYVSDARGWLEGALAHAEAEQLADVNLIAQAMTRLGELYASQCNYTAAQYQIAHSLSLFELAADRRQSAYVLQQLGWVAREAGDANTARLRQEAGLALYRELGIETGMAWALVTLGEVIVMLEEASLATPILEEGLALSRKIGLVQGMGWALNHLGHVAQIEGDFVLAKQRHEESLPLFQVSGVVNNGVLGEAWAFQGLGETALAQGDASRAAAHLRRALALFASLGDKGGQAWCLAGLAGVAVFNEAPERAARLWGAEEAVRLRLGKRPAPASRATHERLVVVAKQQLGEKAYAVEFAEGAKLTVELAITLTSID